MTENKDDNVSEMEDEIPVCCFAFEVICCPQRYWKTTKPSTDDASEGEKKEEEEKSADK